MKFRDGTAKALAWIAEKDLAEERARRKAQNKHHNPSTLASPTRSNSSKGDYDSDIMTGSPSSRRTQSTTLTKTPTLQEIKDAEFCFTDEEDYQGNDDDTISMINESGINTATNNSNKRPLGFRDSARTDSMSEIDHDIDNLIRTTSELDNDDADYDESINNMPLSRKKSIDTVVTTGFFHNKFTEKTANLAVSPVANIVNINIHNMREFFDFIHENFKPSNFKSWKFWQNVIYGIANLVKNSNYISTSQNNKLHLQSFIFGVVSTNITFLIKPLVYRYVSFWIQLVCKLLKHVAVWLAVMGALYIAYKGYMSSSMTGNGNGNNGDSYSNQQHRNYKSARFDANKDKPRVRTSKEIPKLISKYSFADSESDSERTGHRQRNNNSNTNKNKNTGSIQDKIEQYNKKVQSAKSKSKPESNGLTENDMMIIKALAANKLQFSNCKPNKKNLTHDDNDNVADCYNGDGISSPGGNAIHIGYEHTQKKQSHPSPTQPQPQARPQARPQPQQQSQISSAVHNAVDRINQGTRHHGKFLPDYDYKQQQSQQQYGYNYPQTNNYSSHPQSQSGSRPEKEESSSHYDHTRYKNNVLSAKQREYSLFSEDINEVSSNPYHSRPSTAVSPTRHKKETGYEHKQHSFDGERLDSVTPISTKVGYGIPRTPSPVRRNETNLPKKQQSQQQQQQCQPRASNFDIESFNADNDSVLLRREAASATSGAETTTAKRQFRPTSSSATSSSSGSSGTTASSFPPMSLSRISTAATTKTSSSRYTTPGVDTDLMSISSKPFSIESRQQSPSRNYVRTANSVRAPTERAASPHRTRAIFE